MNFSKAIRQRDVTKRNEKIEDIVKSHNWADDLSEHMENGGWPINIHVYKVEITDEEDDILATANMTFDEQFPTGCRDIALDTSGRGTYRVRIDRETGDHEIEDDGVTVDPYGADDHDDDEFDIVVDEAEDEVEVRKGDYY